MYITAFGGREHDAVFENHKSNRYLMLTNLILSDKELHEITGNIFSMRKSFKEGKVDVYEKIHFNYLDNRKVVLVNLDIIENTDITKLTETLVKWKVQGIPILSGTLQ